MISIFDVAKYFLSLTDMADISNLKLQKLCYYAQAYSLALRDEPLFEEPLEAWVHGPVNYALYQKYKKYGSEPIPPTAENEIPKMSEYEKDLIRRIFNKYGIYDGKYLENLTHQENPWIKTRGDLPSNAICNTEIETKDMELYYKSRIYASERNSSNYAPKYKLEDLLSKVTPENLHGEIELGDGRVGGEMI